MSAAPETSEAVPMTVPNTVALIGVILLTLAGGLCGLLFLLVSRLPDGIDEIRALRNTEPAQLQLLIVVCSTAVLTIVSFLLCTVGLFLPNRPRTLAAVGTVASLLLLLGVFGVLVVGTMMNPQTTDTSGPMSPPSDSL